MERANQDARGDAREQPHVYDHHGDDGDPVAFARPVVRPVAEPSERWQYLVLDASREDDPVWLIGTVVEGADVWGAEIADGRYVDWPATCARVRDRLGCDVQLIPVAVSAAWRIERRGRSAAGGAAGEERDSE